MDKLSALIAAVRNASTEDAYIAAYIAARRPALAAGRMDELLEASTEAEANLPPSPPVYLAHLAPLIAEGNA